jgi:uncharacterized repeat protein (TIGR01451 family)
MKKSILCLPLFFVSLFSYTQETHSENFSNQNVIELGIFEENRGQLKDQNGEFRPDVLFYGKSKGMGYFIRNSGISYQLNRIENINKKINAKNYRKAKNKSNYQIETYRVDAEWIDFNKNYIIEKGIQLPGYNNYYNTSDNVESQLYVMQYKDLYLKNIWKGINIHYFSTNGFLETDYIVEPGADYKQIQIQIKGGELSTDAKNNLFIKTPFGEIREGQLKVYQNNELLEAYWIIGKDNIVSFYIPKYNPELALRIDPLTRIWGTYYGDIESDYGRYTTTDIYGNVYLSGLTGSPTGISSGGHQNVFTGPNDAFLVKFNSNGIRQWGTYYGSADAWSITTDITNNIYMTGSTGYPVGIASNGHQNIFGGGANDAFLVKFNSNGVREWGTYYGGTGNDIGKSVKADNLGNIYLAGYTSSTTSIASGGHQNTYGGGNYDAFLVKFNSSGTRIWASYYGGGQIDLGNSNAIDNNGNIYLSGSTSSSLSIAQNGFQNTNGGANDAFLVKFNSNGVREWGTYYGGTGDDESNSTSTDINGNVFIVGRTNSLNNISSNGHQNSLGGLSDAFIVKFDNLGNRQWSTYYGSNGSDFGECSFNDNLGNIYLAGYTGSSSSISSNGFQDVYGGGTYDAFLVKFNSNGVREWGTYYGGSGSEFCFSGTVSNLGNVYLSGYTSSATSIASGGHQDVYAGLLDAFLVKFNQDRVKGNVWLDLNWDCIKDQSELVLLNGFNLIIQPGNYITQSINGIWSIDSLPAGTYTITIDTTKLNWVTTCPVSQTFTVNNSNGFTNGPNFGMFNTNCSINPEVSIFAPSLRRCFSNRIIYVSACNQLTATGVIDSSYVDVQLDPLISLNSASLPYTVLSNNTFRFQTGDLNPGQCVDFTLSTSVSCNSLINQTLCMNATLFPIDSCIFDSIPTPPLTGTGGPMNGFPQPCLLPWDQSSLSVNGWCQNDSVYFTVTNTGTPGGGDMECYSPLWITIDNILTYTDSIMIAGGQTITYAFPGNGQTWILNAEQHPLHPGNSHPNAHVEACGNLSNWIPGMVNQFPQNDSDPIVDIYCGTVSGSYDPNDKTGFPVGLTNERYIQPNQQLQYVIRFQNTGNDTAFTVVIRDTLDVDLNIFSVVSGVSSHPYEFKMYGPRVLEWTFNNIMLPDSNVNEPASNGFVTFHVNQNPNLSSGTIINNTADIYFDFNAPITTNTTKHKIYEGFVSVASINEINKKYLPIVIYPNPAKTLINILIHENLINSKYSILDQFGRYIITGEFNSINNTLDISALAKGLYIIQVGEQRLSLKLIKE